MAGESGDGLLQGLGVILGGAGAIIAIIIKNYLSGKLEGSTSESHGKHVILEQAELRDFGDLPKQMTLVANKMDQTFGVVQGNGADIDEALRILRRLEGELEIAKRLREEKILRDSRDH